MLKQMLLFALLLMASVVSALGIDYENQWIIECCYHSATELQELLNLIDSSANLPHLDLWNEYYPRPSDSASTSKLTIRADAEGKQALLLEANRSAMRCRTVRPLIGALDIRRMLVDVGQDRSPHGVQGDDDFFADYRSYEAIKKQLLAYQENPSAQRITKAVRTIGHSIEGRDLLVIHLTDASIPDRKSYPASCTGDPCTDSRECRPTKRVIWVGGGQHAREWISPSSVMYLVDALIKLYASGDARAIRLLRSFEFVVCPLINPDGYEFSRVDDRFWRKNRRPLGNGVFGVDLNRNWDNYWGVARSPAWMQSEEYRGSEPASEPEVRALQDYILGLEHRLIGFDVHSFAQLILRNFGRTNVRSPKEGVLKRIGDIMAQSILQSTQQVYTSDTAASMYVSTGSCEDWLYDKAGMLGFTIELRDRGHFGHLLPKEQIVPTGEEFTTAVLDAVDDMLADDFPCGA